MTSDKLTSVRHPVRYTCLDNYMLQRLICRDQLAPTDLAAARDLVLAVGLSLRHPAAQPLLAVYGGDRHLDLGYKIGVTQGMIRHWSL